MYGMYQQRRVLRLGSSGQDVAFGQRVLAGAGYNVGPIDGVYGPRTMQAVMQFQADNGLVPDGILGPLTWAAIDAIYP